MTANTPKEFHTALSGLPSKGSFSSLEVGIERVDPERRNSALVPFITVGDGTKEEPNRKLTLSPTKAEADGIDTITLDCEKFGNKSIRQRMRIALTRKGSAWQVSQSGPIPESQMVEPESVRRNLDLTLPEPVTLSQSGKRLFSLGNWRITSTSIKQVPHIGTTKVEAVEPLARAAVTLDTGKDARIV